MSPAGALPAGAAHCKGAVSLNGDKAIRGLTASTVIGVAGVAAFVSYRHAFEVATAHGEPVATAALLPGTIDGLVFVASMVMLDSARRSEKAPGLAKFALALGIGATVAVNVLHGIAHGPIGAVIAAWPAVTLVVVVELLMGMIRRAKSVVAPAARVVSEVEPKPGPAPRETGLSLARPPAEEEQAPEAPEALPEALTEVLANARLLFADVLSSGDVPSVRSIIREMRVGHPKAVRIHETLKASRRVAG